MKSFYRQPPASKRRRTDQTSDDSRVATTSSEDVITRTPSQPTRVRPFTYAFGENGLVSIGDICSFQGLLVLVNSLFLVSSAIFAQCDIVDIVAPALIPQASLKVLVDSLLPSATKVKQLASVIKKCQATAFKSVLESASRLAKDEEYQCLVLKFKLGHQLMDNVSDVLRCKGLRKVSSIPLEYGYIRLLNLGLTEKCEFTLEGGFDRLDGILGKKWDVKILNPDDPTSHFAFVRYVAFTIHFTSQRLNICLKKSISNAPFDLEYRKSALNGMYKGTSTPVEED